VLAKAGGGFGVKIIIIGGGVIGLACAWRLAAGGAKVTLLERRTCGAGASLAALGALWPASALARGPLQAFHRQALRGFPAALEELGRAAGVSVPLQRGGRVEILTSPEAAARAGEEVRAANAEWSDWPGLRGCAMEVLEEGAVRRLLPGVDAPFGGVRCHVTAQVHVASFVAALRAAAENAGATIREHTAPRRLHQMGGRVTAVETAGEMLPLDAVVVAAGAWTNMLPDLPSPFPVVRPVKGQGIALRTPAGFSLGCIVKRGPIYVVPWAASHGEVLVGSTTEPEAAFDETPTAGARTLLMEGASGLLPELAGAAVLRHWSGLRPDGARHRPVMAHVASVDNLYVSAGHYKTGIGLSLASAALMRDAVLAGGPLPTF
jgi:glycine oxidase